MRERRERKGSGVSEERPRVLHHVVASGGIREPDVSRGERLRSALAHHGRLRGSAAVPAGATSAAANSAS
eukprot:ctg_208.g130